MYKKTYYCKKCNYSSKNRNDFTKHCKTLKHTKSLFKCDGCGKQYKFTSGLSRHIVKCHLYKEYELALNNPEDELALNNQEEKETYNIDCVNHDVKDLINIIKKQQIQINESHKMIEKVITETVPKIGNNNNNNISINVYLNENCKNAMNLTDFVEQINVSLEDLLYTQQHGHTEGLANIFTRQLKDMNPTERPIHCSDSKRLQFYIKDDDTWSKDEKHIKIDKTINDVKMKQMKKLKQWEDLHPTYLTDEKLLDKWQLMVREIIGHGDSEKDKEKNMMNIKKKLAFTTPFKYSLQNE
tara:strand:- start:65 stop:958 length:894 start_codon:yes stop_codon:yes gene_type:complete